jgi:hypothetical protein
LILAGKLSARISSGTFGPETQKGFVWSCAGGKVQEFVDLLYWAGLSKLEGGPVAWRRQISTSKKSGNSEVNANYHRAQLKRDSYKKAVYIIPCTSQIVVIAVLLRSELRYR